MKNCFPELFFLQDMVFMLFFPRKSLLRGWGIENLNYHFGGADFKKLQQCNPYYSGRRLIGSRIIESVG